MENQSLLWLGFNLFILLMLALDLGVFHKKAHEVHFREALGWTIAWIVLALLFNLGIYQYFGKAKAVEFLTGYLVEKSLSVDNIFVFVLIFSSFSVPPLYQHRVLFWGLISALLMRAFFIFAGISLISRFHWTIYIFGAFLVFSGIKIAMQGGTKINIKDNMAVKLLGKLLPFTSEYSGSRFIVKQGKKYFATPLFLVLILIETTDLIFAVDSIPAILAITDDPFIVYTSNVFAILGIRSLYFVLSGAAGYFKYLHYGLAAILCFVGIKMCISDYYKLDQFFSLGVIASILLFTVLASFLERYRKK